MPPLFVWSKIFPDLANARFATFWILDPMVPLGTVSVSSLQLGAFGALYSKCMETHGNHVCDD